MLRLIAHGEVEEEVGIALHNPLWKRHLLQDSGTSSASNYEVAGSQDSGTSLASNYKSAAPQQVQGSSLVVLDLD